MLLECPGREWSQSDLGRGEVKWKVAQSCQILFKAMDCGLETHHIHKLDAPSGTAITLAEGILENLDRKSEWTKGTLVAPDGTVSGCKECGEGELAIDSIRPWKRASSPVEAGTAGYL